MEVFFSIIVPVYNAEKYIARCLNSIVCQNYEDYEVILVNDSSTDQSNDECLKYCDKYNNIFLLQTNHIGASGARNVGITSAHGRYLLFVDSDDMIEQGMLTNIYQTVSYEKVDLCYMSRHYVMKNGKKVLNVVFSDSSDQKQFIYSSQKFLELVTTGNNFFPGSMWLIVCRKEYVDRKHIILDENAIWSEDSDFSYNLFINTDKIAVCNYPGYCYYIENESSISKQVDLNKIISRMDIYKKWYLYFCLNESAIKKYSNKCRLAMSQQMLFNYCLYLFSAGTYEDNTINQGLYSKLEKEAKLWKACRHPKIRLYTIMGLRLGMVANKAVNKTKQLCVLLKILR